MHGTPSLPSEPSSLSPQNAQLFLDTYDSFRHLLNALSTLDALAGFAAATHPSAAPPGCAFCRPSFAPGRAGPGVAPPMHLEVNSGDQYGEAP